MRNAMNVVIPFLGCAPAAAALSLSPLTRSSKARKRVNIWLAAGLMYASFAVFATPASAGALSVNGTCEIGNCAAPDALAIKGTESAPFNFIYTLANGDQFQVQGVLSASNSASNTDNTWSTVGTELTVTYLGNQSAAQPSGADSLTVDQIYSYITDGATNGTFGETFYGAFTGPVAATGTSCTFQHLNDGIALPPLGPYSPPGLFSGNDTGFALSGLTNPVQIDVRTTVAFGAGSQPGATIISDRDALSGVPSIAPGGVVPLDSTSSTVQSGSWISIYGSNLAGPTNQWNGNFPTSLAGVSVTIDGKPAYLWYVSAGQINLQVPDDSATGTVDVVVTTLGGTASSTVTLGPYAPSFSLFGGSSPAAIVITPDSPGNSGGGYDLIGPAGAFAFATRPVKAGETLVLFGGGFGPTNPFVPAGQVFAGAAPSVTLPQVTIGGLAATVQFAGITEAGLFQLNVVVPDVPAGNQPLLASVGGMTTQSNVLLAVQ